MQTCLSPIYIYKSRESRKTQRAEDDINNNIKWKSRQKIHKNKIKMDFWFTCTHPTVGAYIKNAPTWNIEIANQTNSFFLHFIRCRLYKFVCTFIFSRRVFLCGSLESHRKCLPNVYSRPSLFQQQVPAH